MVYVGFGKRFLASLIDGLVFLPFAVTAVVLYQQTRTLAVMFTVLGPLLHWAYTIFFHARWGQTLGKRAVSIRIVKVSGEPISWREAFLRSSADVFLQALVMIGTLIALLHFPDSAFGPSARAQWGNHLAEFSPVWLSWLSILAEIWFWSELVTLLFNKKKRALHDFIAGTVVIHERPVRLEKAVS